MPWFSKENFACAILYIIYWFLYDPGGGAFTSSQCPHPGEFANFIKKNANARGVAPEGGGAMGTGGIDWCITCGGGCCKDKFLIDRYPFEICFDY